MKIEQKVLENKLRTIFVDSPGSQVTSVQIWFRAGSALEGKDNNGIAHFLEHMFFKGTKKYPNMMLAKTVESFGGEINAFTSFDYTCYYINGPSANILDIIDVLLDMVSNPIFSMDDLIPERDVVFEEYRRSIDSASQFNFFKVQKNSFPKEYRSPILGSEKSIKSFTQEQLTNFRNDFYNIENAALIVAGDLSKKDKILALINQYQLPSGKQSNFSKFKLKKNQTISTHEKSVNQATITFTIQAPEYDERKGAIEDLAVNCMAFGDISPLYKDLVAKNSLASGVSASSMFFSNGGCHFLKLAFPLESFSEIAQELPKSIGSLFEKGFSKKEIDRIKNQYISSKIYEKETIESFSFALGHGFAQSGDIHCEETFIKNMKDATSTQVNDALLDIFSRPMHAVIQLPNGTTTTQYAEDVELLTQKINQKVETILKNKKVSQFIESEYDPETKCLDLAKNIKLIYRQNLMTPTFTFHCYIKGGVSHETLETNGIYNLISKNITYGYKGFDYEDLKSELDQKSSYINGFSGKNAYGLTLHGLSEHFDSLVEHYFGTLLQPSFPAKYFKLEKELIKRTIHIQKEDPVKNCFKTFNNLVFNSHPYSFDMIGNEVSLRKITRTKVIDLHKQSIDSSQIVFTYCGDLDLETVKAKVLDQAQTLLSKKRSIKKIKNKIKPQNGVHTFIPFDREQTHIMIGKPAFKINTKEDLILKMFTTYLSGQSSELFLEVRDRQGLCYACQPLHFTALEAGYWGIYIGAGFDKSKRAIEAIRVILDQYKDHGIKKTEFLRIKKMIQGQNAIGIQTNDDYASFYSIGVLHDLGLDFQHESFKDIQQITHKEFNEFLKDFLDTEFNIIEVGREHEAN